MNPPAPVAAPRKSKSKPTLNKESRGYYDSRNIADYSIGPVASGGDPVVGLQLGMGLRSKRNRGVDSRHPRDPRAAGKNINRPLRRERRDVYDSRAKFNCFAWLFCWNRSVAPRIQPRKRS